MYELMEFIIAYVIVHYKYNQQTITEKPFKFHLINPDPAHSMSACGTVFLSPPGISCQVLIYFPGMVCYNGFAVNSFQQEGGERFGPLI